MRSSSASSAGSNGSRKISGSSPSSSWRFRSSRRFPLRQQLLYAARQSDHAQAHARYALFAFAGGLPLSWHHTHNTGDIIQRCTSDVDAISNFVSGQLVTLLRIIIMIVLSLTLMYLTDVRLALITTAFLPAVVGYSAVFFAKLLPEYQKCDEEEGVLSTIAQENFTGVRVVRAFRQRKGGGATSSKRRTRTIRASGCASCGRARSFGRRATFSPPCSCSSSSSSARFSA